MSLTIWHPCDQVCFLGQVGCAPLHVAAQTGNLESLMRLLDAGAGRAPRDRVSHTKPFDYLLIVASAHMLLKFLLLLLLLLLTVGLPPQLLYDSQPASCTTVMC